MEKLAIEGGKPVRDTKLHYGHQYIDDADIQAVVDVLKGDFLTCGPMIEAVEAKLCKLTGAKHAVLCSNDTAALHIACMAAGVSAGDEVITTPITFLASANCAIYCNATPVFADIDEHTYNIDPKEIAKKITPKTKAVVAVDYTGQPVDLDPIMEECHKNGVIVIEDAAHSIGSYYKGKAVGNIADMTTFSFHPVKTVTSGEGGAVLTNSDELYERLCLARSHGMTRNQKQMTKESEGGWYYQMVTLGYNYRMTDMQAALLGSQLDKLPMFSERRKQIVERYNKEFSQMPEIIVQTEVDGADTTRHLYILRLNPDKLSIGRKEFFEAMAAENIMCNVHYIPIYEQPFYQERGYEDGQCPKAEALYQNMLTLPLYYAMSDQDVEDVITAVKKIVEAKRK